MRSTVRSSINLATQSLRYPKRISRGIDPCSWVIRGDAEEVEEEGSMGTGSSFFAFYSKEGVSNVVKRKKFKH